MVSCVGGINKDRWRIRMSWSTLFSEKTPVTAGPQLRGWCPGLDRPPVPCSRASWWSVRRTGPTLPLHGGVIVDIILSSSSSSNSSYWIHVLYRAHWSPFTQRPPSGTIQTPWLLRTTWRPRLWTFSPAPPWRRSYWLRLRTTKVCPTAWTMRMTSCQTLT